MQRAWQQLQYVIWRHGHCIGHHEQAGLNDVRTRHDVALQEMRDMLACQLLHGTQCSAGRVRRNLNAPPCTMLVQHASCASCG